MSQNCGKGKNAAVEWLKEYFYDLFIKMIIEILNEMCSIDTKQIELSDEDADIFDFKQMVKIRSNKSSIMTNARKSGVKLNAKLSDQQLEYVKNQFDSKTLFKECTANQLLSNLTKVTKLNTVVDEF